MRLRLRRRHKHPEIKAGDYVKILEQDVTGEVLEVIDDEVVVGFNSIRFKTQLNKVEKLNSSPPKSSNQRSNKNCQLLMI